MALEAATYISQLAPANPGSTDPQSQGDDHLRLIKAVLQSQFPNLGAAAVTGTAAQLNAATSLANRLTFAGTAGTNTYTAAGAPVPASYTDGLVVVATFANANTAAATLNIAGLGAKAIQKFDGTALVTGDLLTGRAYFLIYLLSADAFRLVDTTPVPLPVAQGGTGGTDAATARTNLGLASFFNRATSNDLGGYEVSNWKAPQSTKTGNYTLVPADSGSVIAINSATDITITVPTGLGAGFSVTFVQINTGKAVFSGSGLTVRNRQSHTKSAGQWAVVGIAGYAADTAVLTGDTSA